MYSILHNLRKRYTASLSQLENYQEIAMAGSFLNSEERLELVGFGEKKEFNPGRVASKDNNFTKSKSFIIWLLIKIVKRLRLGSQVYYHLNRCSFANNRIYLKLI